jgi:hypothetical protein
VGERSSVARGLPPRRDAVVALQRSAGNRVTTAVIQRALLQRNGNGKGGGSFNKWDVERSTRQRGRGQPRKARWLQEYEAQVSAVKRFMEDRVAPWATQARIAELINTNFVEMKADPELTGDPGYLRPADYRSEESTEPQIAPGDASFIAPTRTATTAIHRGIVPIEIVENTPHVRVFSALWAEARPNKEGKIVFKDVHQDPSTGAIKIHTGRDQGEAREEEEEEAEGKHPIMWLSAEPMRQLKWFYKYPIEKYNPGAKPVVRSFLIPLELWNSISGAAVSEDEAKKPENSAKPFNVDTAYGSNQFGVRGPLLEQIRVRAAKNSLVSYVGDMSHSKPELGGRILHINQLHRDLGAPTTAAPTPIWVDPGLGKFVRTKKQQGIADELSFYYAIWLGNEYLLPKWGVPIPKERRRTMLREFLTRNEVPLPATYVLP